MGGNRRFPSIFSRSRLSSELLQHRRGSRGLPGCDFVSSYKHRGVAGRNQFDKSHPGNGSAGPVEGRRHPYWAVQGRVACGEAARAMRENSPVFPHTALAANVPASQPVSSGTPKPHAPA
jgi:hypothetical protein